MTPTPPPQGLLTPQEAAEALDVDTSTLHRWATAGRITPAYTAPGRTGIRLYDAAAVAALRDRLEAARAAMAALDAGGAK